MLAHRVTYRPLSHHDKPDPRFDTLHEGLPGWIREPVLAWLRPFLWVRTPRREVSYRIAWLRDLQMRMRLEPPLPWGDLKTTCRDLLDRVIASPEVGLDVLDYSLRHLSEAESWQQPRDDRAAQLARVLELGGSAWEVSPAGDGSNYTLTRRALGPVLEAIEDLRSVSERASDYLNEGWRHLAGRDPNPDMAYFQAVLAVEAAAKPIVSPNDSKATLGRMLGQIRANPGAYSFVLGQPEDVLGPAGLLWENHRRHGTDDRTAPMGMRQEEADAGVHLAITLVRWFAGGAFTPR
jgi:hypothetical protein